ncbi:MAG: hypothetical protein DMG11_34440 [Acidobacteria bacterium]|nr:MAG: hypothetical protein DMG11_34440 [Acidobacteriota bacterium]
MAANLLCDDRRQFVRRPPQWRSANNSWFLRMEDKIGSIEPGKLADLVVLDRDYFAVPDQEIKKIQSVLTVVDGKIVHNAGIV